MHSLLTQSPVLAIALTLTIGILLGKIPFGVFRLGGVAGSLLAGVSVSQFGVSIDDTAKDLFFALFIFAVGYAVTYIFGTLGAIIICGNILPRFMGQTLKDSATAAEADMAQPHRPQRENRYRPYRYRHRHRYVDRHAYAHRRWYSRHAGQRRGRIAIGIAHGLAQRKAPQLGGSIPSAASEFMKDFGLSGFVTIVGLNSDLQAISTIMEQGVSIVFAGLIVTVVPLLIAMLAGRYLLGYRNAAVFAGALSGAQSANPALSQILSLTRNSVPAVPFAVTYALANVFLTLLGPLVVAFV